jgi:hypothetical protein
MADLVRVRLDGVEKNMGRALAESAEVEILDEPTRGSDGRLRGETSEGGRPRKPRTSVAKQVAEKKAVTKSADDQKEKS